ncbi:MAG: hypothetical protein KC496_01090, partial [Anaerolineae bacterium]|nr:hypothetical protein [Anaerolineae bacterium]
EGEFSSTTSFESDEGIRYKSEPPKQYDREEHRHKLNRLIEDLEKQLADTRNDSRRRADLTARLKFARSLALTATFAKPRVFVSYRFDDTGENAVWFLRRVFEEYGFDIVIARDLQNQYITDGVYGSIAQCHFWIGVLTCSATDPYDKKPSPWIQWEYGIARAHPGIIERRLMSDPDIELEKNLIFREVPRFRTDNVRHMQQDVEKIAKEFAISFRERWESRFDNGC